MSYVDRIHWERRVIFSWILKCLIISPDTEGRSYPFVNEPYVYLLTVGLVLAYVILSHIVSMRSLKRWDIVESVKDKE